MDTTTRRQEALSALAEVVQNFRDVFGPSCWCDAMCGGPDCVEQVPATVGLSGVAVVAEWDDLEPEGKTGTTWEYGGGANANKALGMMARVTRRL